MKKIALVVSEYLQNNLIFDNSGIHRDDIFDRFVKLRVEFKKNGYDLSTSDINSIENSEIVIYASNMPSVLPLQGDVRKSYLILSESHFIKPENFDLEKHKYFKKIFTWSDELVDNKKYVKLNYAHLFPEKIYCDLSRKEKLCILISGNKKPPYTIENDLYGERINAIRWFEKHHIDEFDLFGVGWDNYRFTGCRAIRLLNKLPFIGKLFLWLKKEGYPSHQGKVDNKKVVMEKYKFSICYENAKEISGYITEKIFDSFFAGCVPIYWGANNITDHIPSGCFIDKRNYSSYEELYSFISNMSDADYMRYLENIQAYLVSAESKKFKSEGFVETLLSNVIGSNNDCE